MLHSRAEHAYDRACAAEPAVDIEDRLAVIVGQLNALHAQLVDLVAEARDTNAWAGVGIRSLTHWLTWKAGVTNPRAAQLVRLAAATTTPPRSSRTLFADRPAHGRPGRRRRQGPAHHDHQVAEMAPLATVNQLRTIVRCCPAGHAARPTRARAGRRRAPSLVRRRRPLPPHRRPGRRPRAASSTPPSRPPATACAHDGTGRRRPGSTRCSTSPSARSTARRPPAASGSGSTCSSTRRAPVPGAWPDGTPLPAAIRDHLTCDGTAGPGVHRRRPPRLGRPHAAHRRPSAPAGSSCTATRPAGCRGAAPAATSTSTTSSTGPLAASTDYDRLVALCSPLPPGPPPRRCSASAATRSTPDGLVFTDDRGRVITGQPRSCRRPSRRRSPSSRTSTRSASGCPPATSAPRSPTRRSTPHPPRASA